MKKYFLILCLLFISNISFAQWSSVINPQFIIHHESKLNTFVDANGVHIIYWRNGGIKYARLNSAGNVLYYDKIIEPEGANCDFVNIVSINNGQLYAIYKKNNTINVARSVNLGYNWTNSYNYRPMSNSGCDKIVAYDDGDEIHIGWTELQPGSNYYRDTWYIKFIPEDAPTWSGHYNLTPSEYDYGYDPDMTISPTKIHYTYYGSEIDYYGQSWGNPISRDKIKDGGWENPMNISGIGVPSKYKKPVTANNEVNSILKEVACTFNGCNTIITHSDRPYNQGFWNAYDLIRETELDYPMEVESTVDNKIHFIYFDKLDNAWEHRYLSGSTLSGSVAQIYLLTYPKPSLVSNSNDLYLLALGSSLVPGYPVFQHYDTAPLAPGSYAVSVYQSGTNRYPKLTWSLNNEPDVRNKTSNAYKIERRTRSAFNWSNWSILANLGGTVSSFIDYTINTAGGGEQQAEYKLTAIDLGNNASPSQSIAVDFGIGWTDKINNPFTVNEYLLAQNYPNPFNPSTNISYSIKEKGFVSLKIFDMLGREVVNLVNETQDAGKYTIEFNANNLPSGIYIYSIRVNDFIQTCKMSLLK